MKRFKMERFGVALAVIALLLLLAGSESQASTGTILDLMPSVNILTDDKEHVMPLYGVPGEEVYTLAQLAELLTQDDIDKIREGKFTAAYCSQNWTTDWNKSFGQGMTAALSALNIQLLTVTDAKNDPVAQIADCESVIQMLPDLMIIFCQSPDALAPVAKEATSRGIKVVFLNGEPTNSVQGVDFIGSVFTDSWSMGYYSMYEMCKKISEEGGGQVAIVENIYMNYDQTLRTQGAHDAAAEFSNIEVVSAPAVGFTAQLSADNGESLAMAYPDLKGVWYMWSDLSVAAVTAIRNLGRTTIACSPEINIGSAVNMANQGGFYASCSSNGANNGIAAVLMGALGLIEKEAPRFVMTLTVRVLRETLEEAWPLCYNQTLPGQIERLLN